MSSGSALDLWAERGPSLLLGVEATVVAGRLNIRSVHGVSRGFRGLFRVNELVSAMRREGER